MAWRGLETRDSGAALALIEEVRRMRSLDGFADLVMEGVFELIPGLDISYNVVDMQAKQVAWRSLPDKGELMAQFAPVFERLMHENPLVRHFAETGDTRALMWSDFLPVEEMRHRELHQEMFSHLGIDHQLAVTLPAVEGIVVGLAVNSDRPFQERDRAVMNTLRPFLASTFREIQLGEELASVREALRGGGWASALVDETGQVRQASETAATALGEWGVRLEAGAPAPDAIRGRLVDGVARYESTQPATRSMPARLSDDADGIEARYVPSPLGPHVMVVQTGVDNRRRRLEGAGLSPREVGVALELADGGTNAVIAARMRIAEGTVRKHLERVYRGLGVHDRASAIAVIRDL